MGRGAEDQEKEGRLFWQQIAPCFWQLTHLYSPNHPRTVSMTAVTGQESGLAPELLSSIEEENGRFKDLHPQTTTTRSQGVDLDSTRAELVNQHLCGGVHTSGTLTDLQSV